MATIKQISIDTHESMGLSFLDIELIISHVIKVGREYILAYPERKLNSAQTKKIKALINRRKNNEPIAYLTGHQEFFGYDFVVNKNVLVPRPETEHIVDEALIRITHNSQRITIIDVGTGSGCIIITLAKLIKSKPLNTDTQLFGIEFSKKALYVARKNASCLNIDKDIRFLYGNLLEPILKNSKIIKNRSRIIILANLPYLTPKQIKSSPSIQHEPKIALEAGIDGMRYYKKLLEQLYIFKKNRPDIDLIAMCEIDPGQTKQFTALINKKFPAVLPEIKKDLAGYDRLIIF